jgi:uncharacterized protein (DUF1810 family)
MSEQLRRFHAVQEASNSGFAAALAEIETTGKRGHWIWYVFPQLVGLGVSDESKRYGIHGADEAAEYLQDPVLRARLIAVTKEVATKLQGGALLTTVMGSKIDSLKLVSSMTLFEQVSVALKTDDLPGEYAELAELATSVLTSAMAQGYARCSFTLQQLRK